MVVGIIIASDHTHAPIHFSRQPNMGFLVPHSWIVGTCVIEINTIERFDADDFTLSQIGLVASAIAAVCIFTGPGYGGTDFVGPKKVVHVKMYGRHAPGLTLAETAGAGNPSSSSLLGLNNETLSLPSQGGGHAVARDYRA